MAASQIRRFLILHKELDADDGELTRTQKVRRSFIAERYAPLIAALYDGSNELPHRHRGDVRGRPQGRHRGRRAHRRHADLSVARRAAACGRPPNEGRRRSRSRSLPARPPIAARRRAAGGRERLAVVRRREGDPRRVLRHPQGRDPRHHRPQRRRQDVDAQRHQRLLSPAGRHHHLQGHSAATTCAPTSPPARASRAPSRTSRCSRACRRSTTS